VTYYLIHDGYYTRIDTEPPGNPDKDYDEFTSWTEVKKALVESLKDKFKGYKYALHNARALKRKDLVKPNPPPTEREKHFQKRGAHVASVFSGGKK
jgi:hypothetical protein